MGWNCNGKDKKSRFRDNWRKQSKNICREPRHEENKAEVVREIFVVDIIKGWLTVTWGTIILEDSQVLKK